METFLEIILSAFFEFLPDGKIRRILLLVCVGAAGLVLAGACGTGAVRSCREERWFWMAFWGLLALGALVGTVITCIFTLKGKWK